MDDSVWILRPTQDMRTRRGFFSLHKFPKSLPHAGDLARDQRGRWGSPVLTQITGCSHRQWYNWAERRSAGNIRPTPTNTFSLAPRHLQQQRPSKSIQPQPRYRMCMTRRRGGPAGRLRNNVFSAKLKNQPRLLNSQNQGCTEHHYERCWALLWSRWNFCSEKVNIFISEHI